ncbi:MAG: cytochrome c [Gammaproteobacteria bacterium]
MIRKLLLATVVSAGCTGAIAADMKAEDAIRARQSIMRVVGINFAPLAGMAQGKIPFDRNAFAANALRLESVWAMEPQRYFVPGSDKAVSGSKIAGFTDARPAAWSKPADFKAAFDKNGKAIQALAAAARGGDQAAMSAAVGEVGKACKGCHDDFREKQ